MKQRLLLYLITLLFAQSAMGQLNLGWAKFIKGDNSTGNAVATDFSGNIVLAGTFRYSADLDPGVDVLLFNTGGGSNIFVQKLDPQGNLLWARRLNGGTNLKLYDVEFDYLGNVILLGTFSGIFKINPNVTLSASVQDVFIAKFDQDGNFLWAGQVGDPNASSNAFSIGTDENANIYLTGSFQKTADFDPDPNVSFLITTKQTFAMFILKLNPAGQFVWAKSTEGLAGTSSIGRSLAVKGGHVYLTGEIFGLIDFDPGPAVQNVDAKTFRDAFVLKLDYEGNFVWVKHIGGTRIKIGCGIAIDPSGNIITVGKYDAEIDLDPGPGVSLYKAAVVGLDFFNDFFIQKLDPNGNFIWGKGIGGYQDQSASAVATDKFGNVYVTGTFFYDSDFNPGTGKATLTAAGGSDIFILKLDANGNFQEAKRIGGTVDDNGVDLVVDKFNDLILCGDFKGVVDADPGTGVFFMDNGVSVAAFVTKLSAPWDYNGRVFQDLNNNQMVDPGEPGVHGIVLQSKKRELYASTDSLGAYHLQYNIAGDTIRPVVRPYWQISPPAILAGTAQNNYNFAAKIPAVKDLQVSMVEVTHFRPGFETQVVIQIKNVGTLPVEEVPLTLKFTNPFMPAPMQVISMDPAPLTSTAYEFNWKLGQLNVGETHTLVLVFRTPITFTLGTEIWMNADVNLPDDAFMPDNHITTRPATNGSFDPNDKTVRPANVLAEALDTTELQYVIRFQNTGTLAAEFVVIRDTLPLGLDLSTLKVLAVSHQPFTWRLYGPRLLEFRFKPINLPDSTSNEPGSHGFVLFTVKARKDLPLGTLVKNRAGIYFDFNPPVITDFSVMRVGQTVGTKKPADFEPLDFDVSPNPVEAQSPIQVKLTADTHSSIYITVTDVQGKTVQALQLDAGTQKFWLYGLAAGSYFIQVKSGKHAGIKMLIVK